MFTMVRQIVNPDILANLSLDGPIPEVVERVRQVSFAALEKWRMSLPDKGTPIDTNNYLGDRPHGHFYFSGFCANVCAIGGSGDTAVSEAPTQQSLRNVAEIEALLSVLNHNTAREFRDNRGSTPYSVSLSVRPDQLQLNLTFASDAVLNDKFEQIITSLVADGLKLGPKNVQHPETYYQRAWSENFHPADTDVLVTRGTSFSSIATGAQVSSSKALYVVSNKAEMLLKALKALIERDITIDSSGALDALRLPSAES